MKQQLVAKDLELQQLTVKTFAELARELPSGESQSIDELSDQVRTKEEEIQILWNVVKEVNRQKGGALNISQL